MEELNFCPYCDAAQHKLNYMEKNDTYFCRSCNRFFKLRDIKYKCFKCGNTKMEDSEFPSPTGEMVLQCKKCKKMFTLSEFFEKNEEIID
jgi:uncharacterized protein YbaR (Trm112 family)